MGAGGVAAARGGSGTRVEVVVTGLGVVSPLGCGVGEFWDGLTGGAVGTGPVDRFDTAPYGSRNGGSVRGFDPCRHLPDPTLSRLPLAVQYAVAAGAAALDDAGLTGGGEVGVCLGTVMGTRPHLERLLRAGADAYADLAWAGSAALADVPAAVLGLTGPTAVVSSGCSAGNDAIGYAADLVAGGQVDCVVAGGAEELSEAVFALFTGLRALTPDVVRPFDARRRGILPAEGAAALVLESAGRAAARGARVYCRVAGYAAASDAHHVTAPHPAGRAVAHCLRAALHGAGLPAGAVGYVSAHGTGTPASDGIEAAALAGVFAGSPGPAVSSVKGALGHAQGAAGALEAVVCALALDTGTLPGMPTLTEVDPACAVVDLVRGPARAQPVAAAASVAFGFGGSASALVFGSPR